MLKKLALFCALIGMVAIAGSAYAEVQNIRVSGDLEAKAVYRDSWDLENDGSDTDSFLMSIMRLQVDADLTDNVSATVRLANIRDWDADARTATSTTTVADSSGNSHTAATTTTVTDGTSIILDLAYITLKEMLYSPLTLIIGRQELMYGNGLIVGNDRRLDPNNSIEYNDLSPLSGYDAVRFVLDYDPLTIDFLMAKITENDDSATQDNDGDTDLYGVNLGYLFDSYDAEMEGYFFAKRDENFALTLDNTSEASSSVFNESKTYTLGLRGSLAPMENLSLAGEIAGQFGKIYGNEDAVSSGVLSRDRKALAVNVAGEYTLADVKFAPVLGVEYLYLSGEKGNGNTTGDYEAWNPMYRSKRMSIIRGSSFATADTADTSGLTNQHTLKVAGSANLGELVDGLSLDLAYLKYWFAEDPIAGADDDIGDEINLTIAYDYTEDVLFALESAVFIPGAYYNDIHGAASKSFSDNAVSVIGSCKVSF